MRKDMYWVEKARIALSACILGFAAICATHTMTYADVTNTIQRDHVKELSDNFTTYKFLGFSTALFSNHNLPVPSLKPDFQSREELSKSDIKLYERVFELQAAGDIEKADEALNKVKDKRLMGHVLHQRYMHPTAYTSTFKELEAWMALYANHPGAKDVYELALKKKPEGYDGDLRQPITARAIARMREPGTVYGKKYSSNISKTAEQAAGFKALKSQIKKEGFDDLVKAFDAAEQGHYGDAVELDTLRGDYAARLLYTGKIDEAIRIAAVGADRSKTKAPKAAWLAGLGYWTKGDFSKAAKYFEMVGASEYASGWTQAGGAFWAARSHMRTGNVSEVSTWLEKAEAHPRTFYGLLAARALGRDFKFNWDEPTFTKEHYALLSRSSAGQRAMALVSVGQMKRAEDELMHTGIKTKEMRQALLAYAAHADLPSLAMRLGALYKSPDGSVYDSALYPVGPWAPKAGYNIDPALIHAIMRQESRFDTEAESHSGARGLMQLMPVTASYVAGSREYKQRSGIHKLNDPKVNLDIGQRYVAQLLKSKQIKNDMLSMLIAYNAGPGSLNRWKTALADVQDPLLFIELVPVSETRDYVERVLANYWIYRLRDNLDTPSLDALAAGRIARYAGMPGEAQLALAQ